MNNSPKHWEAPISPNVDIHPSTPMEEDIDANLDEDLDITGNGRKIIENALRQPVTVDCFPSSLAGTPIGNPPSHATNEAYSTSSTHNPYAPFASQLDWEVARWAKLRGPGATAITELLKIPGVSFSILLMYKYGFLILKIVSRSLRSII
jgi:hypothetical protein